MPPRRLKEPILAVQRTQHTPSSEPDDEEDSTPDPRYTSGSSHRSELSPEVTREPSDDRSHSYINEFILLELDAIRRQNDELMTRLGELLRQRERPKESIDSNPITPCQADIEAISIESPTITYDPTPDADLAPPLLPVEDPENSDINLNKHSYNRSAQEEVSAPQPGDTPITSIQGEDPKDPRDEMIPIQDMVSCTENPNTMPITTNFTTVPKTTVTNLPVQTQDWSGEYQPTEIDNKPVKVTNEPAKGVLTTGKLLGSTVKGGNIRSIMTKGYAYMHARRPHVLALQGIG